MIDGYLLFGGIIVLGEYVELEGLSKDELINIIKKLDKKAKSQEKLLLNIAHDLRNPISVILSVIQCISYLDNVKNNEKKRKEYRKIIRRNCLKMMKLIDNLIDTTKLEENNYEINKKNIDIVNLIENTTISVLCYAEQKNIQIIFDTNEEECTTLADPQSIDRIITNLLSNAIKFSPKDGLINVNVFIENETINISVIDQGPGIKEEDQKRIFNRFAQASQAKNSEKCGSGIGLDLVNYLSKLHNGNVTVKSEFGKGAEFIVTLPVDKSNEEVAPIETLTKSKVELLEVEFSDIYL